LFFPYPSAFHTTLFSTYRYSGAKKHTVNSAGRFGKSGKVTRMFFLRGFRRHIRRFPVQTVRQASSGQAVI